MIARNHVPPVGQPIDERADSVTLGPILQCAEQEVGRCEKTHRFVVRQRESSGAAMSRATTPVPTTSLNQLETVVTGYLAGFLEAANGLLEGGFDLGTDTAPAEQPGPGQPKLNGRRPTRIFKE